MTVEISAQNDAPVRGDPQAVSTQQASSTLSGSLGEWMELGGTGQQDAVDDGAVAGVRQRLIDAVVTGTSAELRS